MCKKKKKKGIIVLLWVIKKEKCQNPISSQSFHQEKRVVARNIHLYVIRYFGNNIHSPKKVSLLLIFWHNMLEVVVRLVYLQHINWVLFIFTNIYIFRTNFQGVFPSSMVQELLIHNILSECQGCFHNLQLQKFSQISTGIHHWAGGTKSVKQLKCSVLWAWGHLLP